MRQQVAVAAVVALTLLGSKCKGPKAPGAEAAAAAEQAWVMSGVKEQLAETAVVELDVDVDSPSGEALAARVRFTRSGAATLAVVSVGDERFVFWATPSGEMVDATGAAR